MEKSRDELNVIFKSILDICFRIHTMYGPGMLESFYVELKSKLSLVEAEHKQIITYLKTANKRLGLLVNFGESHLKNGIHRKVNGF